VPVPFVAAPLVAVVVVLTLLCPTLVLVTPPAAAAWVLPVFVVPTLVPPSALALIDPGPVSEGAASPEELQASSGFNQSTVQKTWTDFMARLLDRCSLELHAPNGCALVR
jgi:hypothetical protein